MINPKTWKTIKGMLKSKTFWFNLVTGGLIIVNELNGKLIPTDKAAMIITFGNIVLRMITSKPLSEK